MISSEQVIKGLEICVKRVPGKYICNECPYEIYGNCCEINLTNDAISLLKEQKKRINELEEKLRLLEFAYQHTCTSGYIAWRDDTDNIR